MRIMTMTMVYEEQNNAVMILRIMMIIAITMITKNRINNRKRRNSGLDGF